MESVRRLFDSLSGPRKRLDSHKMRKFVASLDLPKDTKLRLHEVDAIFQRCRSSLPASAQGRIGYAEFIGMIVDGIIPKYFRKDVDDEEGRSCPALLFKAIIFK